MGEAMMMPKPEANHEWLQQLVGDWTFVSEAMMGPDQPPMQSKGTEKVHSLVGGLWVICEGVGEMPDGCEGQMRMSLGYNPDTGRFVGSWIGSMMNYLWVYDGWLDESRRILTLEAQGPLMDPEGASEPGQTATYRDVIEIVDENTRILRGTMPGPDGEWMTFMTATYTRVK